ncbi:MAG: GTPase [Croceivirga sp.]
MDKTQKLLFVYNANSGRRNSFIDSIHKLFSPNTYECHLCELTYGFFLEDKRWKRFRKTHTQEMIFLHKDEFTATYKSKFGYKFTFPIVLITGENGLEVLVSTKELNQITSVHHLIQIVGERV